MNDSINISTKITEENKKGCSRYVREKSLYTNLDLTYIAC